MDTKYPLYTPKDIFISFCGREATEAERWQGVQSGIIFHKRTGNEFLDLFVSMVHHYMIRFSMQKNWASRESICPAA